MKPYYDDDTVQFAMVDPPAAEQVHCSACGSPATTLRRSWCRACYLRWFKAGKPEGGPPPLEPDSLALWRELPIPAHDREPTDLEVGAAGEHIVCADLLLQGFRAFRSDQSCAYDVAVDLGGRLIRLQVKSTRKPKALPRLGEPRPAYQYAVRRSGVGGRKTYARDAFDLLAVVALDIRRVAYMRPIFNRTTVQISLPGDPAGKQFADYPFTRVLHDIGAMP